MAEPMTLSVLLAQALLALAPLVVEYGGVLPLKEWLAQRRRPDRTERDLAQALDAALRAAGVVGRRGELADEGWRQRLEKLAQPKQAALRRLVLGHALFYTDPDQPIPPELQAALRWPESETPALSAFLLALRRGLAAHPAWAATLHYLDREAERQQRHAVQAALDTLQRLVVTTPEGAALRVQLAAGGLTPAEYGRLEQQYRDKVAAEHRRHAFRGIAQFQENLRLPLADIYVALGVTRWRVGGEPAEEEAPGEGATGAALAQQRLEQLRRRADERQSLAVAQRLVVLGEPGAGKSMTLAYLALRLAQGAWAALDFDAPYLPLLLPLREFAAEGAAYPSLTAYLLHYIAHKYPIDARGQELVRLALENGHCVVLLDGLDEVGDTPAEGQLLRPQVVRQVQSFADQYCQPPAGNRLIVTSRKEGYRDAMLADVTHVELNPLRPPEEIENFLLRFYTAWEQEDDPALDEETARVRAQGRVAGLLPQILGEASVLLLATNPLLLTILVLIYEAVGQLPNRRVKLYQRCAETLIASWRKTQKEKGRLTPAGAPRPLPANLDEETLFKVLGRLAYWLHAYRPGGAVLLGEWQAQLEAALRAEEVGGDVTQTARDLLDFCRLEAGLLAERGLGRFGFFHLTFEEYLAGYAIAHAEVEEQEELLRPHWENPRWREVILLAAGEVGIVMNHASLTRLFLQTVLALADPNPASAGRAALLTGRALLDIGTGAVREVVAQDIVRRLRQTMQAWDEEHPRTPAPIPPPLRAEAGQVLDALGWLPSDLNHWVCCPACGDQGETLYAARYPVTNAQFELFLAAGGYDEPAYWGGEESPAWAWRLRDHRADWRGAGPVREPEYWQSERFGRQRRGYPVVGVSWYEAQAYCAWLSRLLARLRAGEAGLTPAEGELVAELAAAGATTVRLPTQQEWVRLAGGDKEDRYPWDGLERATRQDGEATITARANVREAEVGSTTPVGMYPAGASDPFALWDMAGNVWEWTTSWYDQDKATKVVRGGAWNNYQNCARVAARHWYSPSYSNYVIGFRVVSPVVLAAGC